MNTKSFSITSTLLIALSLSAAQAGMKKSEAPAPNEASTTLKDIEQSAAMVETKADELMAFAGNTTLSPESRLVRLNVLRDELNRAGQDINRLEGEMPAPWERQAVGKAGPLLADAAANTQKAFEYFKENRNRLWTQDFESIVERISSDATHATKILKEYMGYAQAREREEQLEQRIGSTGE